MADLSVTSLLVFNQVAFGTQATLRLTQEVIEIIYYGSPNLLLTQEVVETPYYSSPNVLITQEVVEVIRAVTDETKTGNPYTSAFDDEFGIIYEPSHTLILNQSVYGSQATLAITQDVIEVLYTTSPNFFVTQDVIEILRSRAAATLVSPSSTSTFTQTVIGIRSPGNTIVPSSLVLVSIATATGYWFRSASNPLVFTITAIATKIKTVSSALTLTSTIQYIKSGAGSDLAFNILNLQQDIIETRKFDIHPSTTLTLNQSNRVTSAKPTSSTLALTSTLTYTHTHAIKQNLNLTQSISLIATHQYNQNQITFNQTLHYSLKTTLISSLTFTSSAKVSRSKLLPSSSSIAFNQSIKAWITNLNQHITQQIVFQDQYLKAIPINNQYIYVPVATFSKPTTKCQVILYAPKQVLVLPCPLFGDTQSLSDSMVLKKTMTGLIYTYVKQSDLQKLKYDFLISKNKALEVRSFLQLYYSDRFTMNNWKGENWLVFITNDPIDMVTSGIWDPGQESVKVTLEFEGVKIN